MRDAATRLLDRLRGRRYSRVDLRHQGRALLRRALGDQEAEFRDDQWEAIERLIYGRERLLVVQRTGWGKSSVYFLTACMLRDEGAGPTLVVSPLLSLMRNQILAATRLGVRAATINSTNRLEWTSIESDMRRGRLDVLLVAPERLASKRFRAQVLEPMAHRVGSLVIDEAHCISDWGHDFRPDYRRIRDVLDLLPRGTPLLATTATANDRVIRDVVQILGPRVRLLRGPLARDSLRLQTIDLPSQAGRLAWLGEQIPRLPGAGIIYCLTVHEAQRVAAWLQTQGIEARAYHSRLEKEEREALEQRLLDNQIKVLVATVALGMGFDKPDLGFVIHHQRPASAVHYYQQVGRAGRAIDAAYGVLLSGEEDDDITTFFIESAFPPDKHVGCVLTALGEAPSGLTMFQLEQRVNVSGGQLERIIKLLATERPPLVIRRRREWFRTDAPYHSIQERASAITRVRRLEQRRMAEYASTETCLMGFLLEELDDPTPHQCGRCSGCLGKPILPDSTRPDMVDRAIDFLFQGEQVITPQPRWPAGALSSYGWTGEIPPGLRHEPGRALSVYGDEGWGQLVRRGKLELGRFDDGLVAAGAELVRQRWHPSPPPAWVTCVPSLAHPDLVPSYARRLAEALDLPFQSSVLKVRHTAPQKLMQNEFQQAHNLAGVFKIAAWEGIGGPVLLVDDIVDSGWTFAVVAALLRDAGSGPVFPLALAATQRPGAI